MSNLPLVDPIKKSNDSAVQNFVDGYYSNNYNISSDEYDAVRTFFLARTKGDATAADTLTSSVLTIAYNRNIKPLSIVDEFKHYRDNTSFTAALLAFMNTDRRNTSKLGYAAVPEPDQYVVRNIGS